ncbi:MAG: hypothetical protein ACRDTV_01115, partial [Mycobacterium sp.]
AGRGGDHGIRWLNRTSGDDAGRERPEVEVPQPGSGEGASRTIETVSTSRFCVPLVTMWNLLQRAPVDPGRALTGSAATEGIAPTYAHDTHLIATFGGR